MNTKLVVPALIAGALAVSGVVGVPGLAAAAQTYKATEAKTVAGADGKAKYESVTTKVVTTGKATKAEGGKLKFSKSEPAYSSVETKTVTDKATGEVIYKAVTTKTVEK